jgi:hypothetical protein
MNWRSIYKPLGARTNQPYHMLLMHYRYLLARDTFALQILINEANLEPMLTATVNWRFQH